MPNPWLVLQDILPNANQWPGPTRRKFWCSNLNYNDRCYLAGFGYLNGVAPDLLIETIQFCNTASTPVKLRKIVDLYNYWSDPVEGFQRRTRYFSYSFYFGFVTDLNGLPRINVNRNRNPNNHNIVRNIGNTYHC